MRLKRAVGIAGLAVIAAACGGNSGDSADAATRDAARARDAAIARDAAAPDAAAPDAAAPDAARTVTRVVLDPRATYLRTDSDTPEPPAAFDLAALGISPGTVVTLRRAGSFDNGNGHEFFGLTGVFSATNVILATTAAHRVPGAIDAGDDVETWTTYFPQPDGLVTDIPEDFEISPYGGDPDHVTLTVPDGAAYLFVSPLDSYFVDNVAISGVSFELVIEH